MVPSFLPIPVFGRVTLTLRDLPRVSLSSHFLCSCGGCSELSGRIKGGESCFAEGQHGKSEKGRNKDEKTKRRILKYSSHAFIPSLNHRSIAEVATRKKKQAEEQIAGAAAG
ncbi:hypothetical protein BHM03_00045372 [Ensete ventricosum]|uniref:Uncharacterized protein n=1 Tax=Ensete ventricosum TaxID=4639 RepID=A0A426YC30_ENSVE|nr:hypothetical protein B296_00041498 [Ensete ventricosum]RZS13744.1 hypothetical protein BHM03_00045372 [Ensete ventricosum]